MWPDAWSLMVQATRSVMELKGIIQEPDRKVVDLTDAKWKATIAWASSSYPHTARANKNQTGRDVQAVKK